MKIILKIVGMVSALVLSVLGLSGCDRFIGGGQDLYGVPPVFVKNSEVEMYCGDKVKGSDVKTLISQINRMNEADYFPKDLIIKDTSNANITLSGDEYVFDDSMLSMSYKITTEYGEDGYVTEVHIENSSEEQNS